MFNTKDWQLDSLTIQCTSSSKLTEEDFEAADFASSPCQPCAEHCPRADPLEWMSKGKIIFFFFQGIYYVCYVDVFRIISSVWLDLQMHYLREQPHALLLYLSQPLRLWVSYPKVEIWARLNWERGGEWCICVNLSPCGRIPPLKKNSKGMCCPPHCFKGRDAESRSW